MSSDILIYQNPDGDIKIDVRLEEESVWLSQDQMATLFGKAKSTINEHIKNVFAEGELDEKVVVRKFRITTQHGAIAGKTQEVEVFGYNLDVIISVGYRVKSVQGTQYGSAGYLSDSSCPLPLSPYSRKHCSKVEGWNYKCHFSRA